MVVNNVVLDNILSRASAVGLPGLIPGIDDPYFFVGYSDDGYRREYVLKVVAQFKVSRDYSKVTFVDKDGSVVGEDYVPKHRCVNQYDQVVDFKNSFAASVKPYVDEEDNYWEFSSWDKDLTRITEDTVVNAVYKINEDVKVQRCSVPSPGAHESVKQEKFTFDNPIVGILNKGTYSSQVSLKTYRDGLFVKDVKLENKQTSILNLTDCINEIRLQSGQTFYVFVDTKYSLDNDSFSTYNDSFSYQAKEKDEVIVLNNRFSKYDSSKGGYVYYTLTKANVHLLIGNELIVPEGITDLTIGVEAKRYGQAYEDLCGKIQLPNSLENFYLDVDESGYHYSYVDKKDEFPEQYFTFSRGCGYLGNASNPYLYALYGTADYIQPGTKEISCNLGSCDVSTCEEIVIPESVSKIDVKGQGVGKLVYEAPEKIESFNFEGYIDELEIPNENVINNSDWSFSLDINANKLIIPSNVNKEFLSRYCYIKEIVVKDHGEKIMQMIDGFLVDTRTKTLLYCPTSRNQETIIINADIEYITADAFVDETIRILKIYIPESVKEILAQRRTSANFFCIGQSNAEYCGSYIYGTNKDGSLTIVNDFIFGARSDGAYLIEYTGPKQHANIQIPSSVVINDANMPVVAICASTLQDLQIDSLVIPEGVTKIDQGSFNYSTFSCDIVLPSTLPYVYDAFYSVKSTKHIKVFASIHDLTNAGLPGYTKDIRFFFPFQDPEKFDAEYHLRAPSVDMALDQFYLNTPGEKYELLAGVDYPIYFEVNGESIKSSEITSWTTSGVVTYVNKNIFPNLNKCFSLVTNQDEIDDYIHADNIFLPFMKELTKADNNLDVRYVFKDKELLEYYLFEKLFDGEALFTKVNNSTIKINDKFYKEASLESHDDKVDKVEAYVGEELISYNVMPY